MVPKKFHKFLQSGCNKTRLIELPFEYLQLKKNDLLQTLRSDDLVLWNDNSCVVASNAAVMEDLNLPATKRKQIERLFCIVQIFFKETMGRMYAYGPHVATHSCFGCWIIAKI